MTIASVLVILQMAVSLLVSASAPGTSPALQKQAQEFANQAIAISTQALSQSPTTQLGSVPASSPVSSTSTSSGIQVTYNPPSQPVLGAVQNTTVTPPVVPSSCTLTATLAYPSNIGKPFDTVTLAWTIDGVATTTPIDLFLGSTFSTDTRTIYEYPFHYYNKTSVQTFYMGQVGNATCYAFWPKSNGPDWADDHSNLMLGDTTSPNKPSWMQGWQFVNNNH